MELSLRRIARLHPHCGARVLLAVLALAALPTASGAQNLFGESGFSASHGTYAALPYEHVDPLSGNLIVVVTDLALPGNAGLDLRVTRTYNSKFHQDFEHGQTSVGERTAAGVGWRLHFGRVLHTESTQPGITIVETPDGGGQPLYQQSAFSEGWISKGFLRYNRSNHTAKLPNGLVYTFGHVSESGGPRGTVRAVTAITDPFGNRLTFEYGGSVPGSVTRVRQDLGSGQLREVTFTYGTNGALETMTYDGRTWVYEHEPAPGASGHTVLRRVRAPLGPPWEYQYTNNGSGPELTRLQAPGGGYIDYTHATVSRRASSLTQSSRVVTTRNTGGFRITPGTWTFSYDQGSNRDTTTVACPCGTTSYRFNGVGRTGTFNAWLSGTLAERTVEEAGVVLEREQFTYQRSVAISPNSVAGENGVWTDPDVFNALAVTRTLTRGGSQTWTTTLEYHTTDFNDYGQAWRFEETGEATRRIARTFQTGFVPWIVGRVASQSVTVGPESVPASWTYDPATGFLTQSIVVGTRHDYQPTVQGNLLAVINANGHRTTFSYAWGVSSGSVTPLTTTSRAINGDGSVASETIGNATTNLTTRYEYDLVGRPRVVRPPGANPIVFEYDGIYDEYRAVERGTSFTRTMLDGFGRAVSASDAVGLKMRVERDACGRVTFSSAPYTTGEGTRGTRSTYDALGRTRTVIAADTTSVTQHAYPNGDVRITDAAGRVTQYDYSGFGAPGERLVEVIDAAGQVTSYQYDLLNHLTRVTGPTATGPVRHWIYNGRGQLAEDTQPESGRTQYFYDPAGNLQRTVDALGRETVFTYDLDERLTNRNGPGASADVALEYDVLGRVWRQSIDGVVTTFTFDAAGRPASRTDGIHPGQAFTSSYAYEGNDTLQRITYPSGRQVTYQYDPQGRLTAVLNDGVPFASNFHYDDSGRLDWYFTGPVRHGLSYDVRDRVQQLTAGPVGSPALSLTYSFNSISQVLGITDTRPSMSQTFEYDVLDRLKVASGPWGRLEWTYDAQGNRLTEQRGATTAYHYQPTTQRLTSTTGAATESFAYNAVGELTNDGNGSYTYSPAGMLRTATRAGMTASYLYDADQRRAKRQVNDTAYFTVRSVGGQVLSEHQVRCGGVTEWVKDNIYAGSRLLGAVKNNTLAPPAFAFAHSGGAAYFPEGAGAAGIGVKVVTPTGAPLTCAATVSYETVSGSAAPHQDYTPVAGTLTFPAGTASGALQYVMVPLLNDSIDESDESFTVRVTGATGGVLVEPTSHPNVIQDDDAAPSLTVRDATPAGEGAGPATFRVELTAASAVEVRVTYATANQTAAAGSDYTAVANTLILAPGTPYADVVVPILEDTRVEGHETFTLTLSAPVNATIADGQAVGTITDNEPPRAPIDLTLPGQFYADVTANVNEPDFLVIANPTPNAVTTRLTFTRPDGSGVTRDVVMAGSAKVSLNVAAEAGLSGDVSVAVQSVNAPYALDGEHVAYWGPQWQGGRATEGVSPAPTWYFAEGSIGYFEEWLTVFNPTNAPIDVTFEFFGTNGLLQTRLQRIAEGPGRFKVRVRDWLGVVDHGTRITGRTVAGALAPIVAERTMTWEGDRREGHSTPGQAALATNWLFAEGDSGFFSTFIAVVNPHPTALPVVVGYYHENQTLYYVGATVPAQSRLTIAPPSWLPAGSFGLIVGTSSGLGFAAERAMYGTPTWTLGHAGVGVAAARTDWQLAEGQTGAFWDTYILVVNPGATPAGVTLAFLKEGDPNPHYYGLTVPAYTRRTVWVNTLPGMESTAFLTVLGSTAPVVMERAIYWPRTSGAGALMAGGEDGAAGAASLAVGDATPVVQASTDRARPTPIVPVEALSKTGLLRTPYDARWPRLARPRLYHVVTEGKPANEAAAIASRGAPPTTESDVGPATSSSSTPQSLSSGSSTWYGAHLVGGRSR
jgi:YD repeat-containing protein